MKYTAAAAVLLSLAACATPPAATTGQLAFTTRQVYLHAGPDGGYPVVAVLPQNQQVAVQGCLRDYSWCDVLAGPQRGWMYGGDLAYTYQNAARPLPSVAPLIGIAILGFVLYDYWDDHYRDRDWYRDRDRWPRPPGNGDRPEWRDPHGSRPPQPAWDPRRAGRIGVNPERDASGP